ncbi:signal recognition particle subunit Srp14p [Trichomonascus vanleenenianus]|uniref:RNA-binding signal recognition particle subunit SRP14 n=1 Tax=Trichomonascus vanleenenianus TaxID=2268995 RepID=UPI003ECA0C9C
MATNKLSNDEFLVKLKELFAASEQAGSVYLHQKRLTDKTDELLKEDGIENENGSYSVLFRATDGKSDKKVRQKISTVVVPGDLEKFWEGYTEAVKSGMGGLRKKDKKKKSKKKA